MGHPLDPLLAPESVVVVGASRDPGKRGHQAVRALQEAGYRGAIYPVHPDGGELLGLPVVRSVADLEGAPELALICTPASTVPAVLEACAAKGVRAAVVLAVGFRESSEEGARLETRLLEVARRTGVRVLGPNTSGLLNSRIGLNLVGARGVAPGRVALIGQSGNIALALLNESMAKSGQGLSIYVGVGNETDVAFHEVLDYVGSDPQTAAILMYVEGLRDGRAFYETACRVSAQKPIVLLKGGRSGGGRAAVRSHTGAIAGSYAVFRAALRQAGVIEVDRSDELFQVGRTLAEQPPIAPGTGVVVVSDGGGHAVLAADALAERGVSLAPLSEETRRRLREQLGPAASVTNPIDLAGASDRDPRVFARALAALASDPAVGGALVVGLFGGYALRFDSRLDAAEVAAAESMGTWMAKAGKTLVVHSLYAAPRGPWARADAPSPRLEALARLLDAGVPVVESLELACRCIAAASARGALASAGPIAAKPLPVPRPPHPVLEAARREGRCVLLEPEARALAAAFGVPVAPGVVCTSAGEAAAEAERAGAPVALKLVSATLPHKTEAGGVALNVVGGAAARDAFEQIRRAAETYAAAQGRDAGFRGVLVVPMQPPPVAELLVGVRRDEHLGPVLCLGIGGWTSELLQDVALRLLPVDREEVLAMLDELRLAPLIRGYRGRPAANRGAIADLALALAECALAHPEVTEIEANPVFAYPDRAVALDLRAFVEEPRPGA